MSKVQNSIAEQVKEFTTEAAAILTAAAPAFLLLVILVAACAASYIEYLFHADIVGANFAYVSGGSYGLFRFSVGGAGVQMAKINRWVPAALFVAISLAFTVWSTFHVGAAAELLRVGGSAESAEIILTTILWTAFAGELVLGVFSFSMDAERKN